MHPAQLALLVDALAPPSAEAAVGESPLAAAEAGGEAALYVSPRVDLVARLLPLVRGAGLRACLGAVLSGTEAAALAARVGEL